MMFWDKHKSITDLYEEITRSVCEKYDLTQMEYGILMFLGNNPEFSTAADIVKVRRSTKSHVSTSLKTLEEKGLISRKQHNDNKKHVEIVLLEPTQDIIHEGKIAQEEFRKVVFEGFSEDEIKVFNDTFQRICMNAEEELLRLQKKND